MTSRARQEAGRTFRWSPCQTRSLTVAACCNIFLNFTLRIEKSMPIERYCG